MTDASSLSPADAADPYRLPKNVLPSRYEIMIEPDLDEATFVGTSVATLDVLETTNTFVLNAIELDITTAWLEDADGNRYERENLVLDEATERLTLEFGIEATPGMWTLHTAFTGILNDKLHGFYRSTFTDTDGVEQTIATTQFEATDARRAFPCWDEPELKAVFSIILVVPAELTAVSNAAEVSRTIRSDGKVEVLFADTMKMSTYLVAFVVGPLDITEPVDAGGTPLRIVYPRGKGHLTAWALEVGAFTLDFFADYYGIPYPGDKLDLVAVPDFAFGAMENLGCVTFREVALLVDPDTVTQDELQRVTDVITHELAHMWFGDLVTMKWWNGIWLNEAFATFMEMLATDAFRPEWDRWSTFGLSRTAAFDVDSLGTTRPIEFPVVSPDEAEGMFDILTYEKGAAVVRMLEQYLGADVFREGIRSYLAEHAYGNTETTDLWDAIEAASGEPVRRIMDSWIFQGGYPLISVETANDGDTLRLSQQRFAYADDIEGDADPSTIEGERWSVPVLLTVGYPGATADGKPIDGETDGGNGEANGGDAVSVERILVEEETHDIELFEPLEWVFVNTESTGFYRVRYASALREAVANRAQEILSPIERYSFVDDAWSAVLADAMTAEDFLELIEGFDDETDLSVWQRIIASIGSLDRILDDGEYPRDAATDDSDARVAFQNRVRTLLRQPFDRLGITPSTDDTDRDRSLRGALFQALGTVAVDEDIRVRARDLFARGSADVDAVDPALFAASIAVIAASGGEADFDDFLARAKAASNPQEEQRYQSALADFDEEELVERALELCLTDEIRSQDAPYLVRRVLWNREHAGQAWIFVMENWDALNERFPSNSIVRMLEGIRALSMPQVAPSVFTFFEEHDVPQGDRQLAQHLERLEVNVALRNRETVRLARALT